VLLATALLLGVAAGPAEAVPAPASDSVVEAADPAGERAPTAIKPGLFDILRPSKDRFAGTGRRHIVVQPHRLVLWDGAVPLWAAPFSGEAATPEAVAAAVQRSPRPDWMQQSAPGVVTLRAALVQAPGTSLVVAAPAVRELRLAASPTLTYVAGLGATATFRGVRVTSWNEAAGAPSTDVDAVRPFVVYRSSTLTMERCDMSYLGSDRFSAYGVNWDVGSTGSSTSCTFHHNYFGAYTAGAHHVAFRRNSFHDNLVYGLDPHSNSAALFIEDNDAFANGSHGIVTSLGVVDSVIRGNRSHGNGRNGIVLDRRSDRNVVERNQVADNAQDGIVLIGSSHNSVRDNVVTGHRIGIRIHKTSVASVVEGNRVSSCQTGLQVYDGAPAATSRRNVVDDCLTGLLLRSPGTVSTDDVVRDSALGVKADSLVTLRGTEVVGSRRGVVVTSRGILDAADVTIRSRTRAVTVQAEGVARVRHSLLQGTTPVLGRLRLDADNVLQPWATAPPAGSGPPFLGVAGATFVGLAVLLHLLHRMRNGSARDARTSAVLRRRAIDWSRRALAGATAVAGGLLILHPGPGHGPAVTPRPDGSVVVVRGSSDLRGLADALRESGHADALTWRDGGWLVNRPVTISNGARLRVEGQVLRLRSSPGRAVGITADGGQLLVRDSTVTSWDPAAARPDANVADGRAWLLAARGGRLDLVGSRVRDLGYDAPGRYGLSWTDRATRGRLERTSVDGGFRGADVAGAASVRVTGATLGHSVTEGMAVRGPCAGLRIEYSVLRGNGTSGLLLTGGCAGAVVRASGSHGNRGAGIAVSPGSDTARLAGNEVYGNGGAGIDVGGATRTRLAGNLVYANPVGVSLHDGAAGTELTGNRIAGNGSDGVHVERAAAGTVLRSNRIEDNVGAGLSVERARVRSAGGDRLDRNAVGADVGPAASVALVGTALDENSDNGLRLAAGATAALAGSSLRDNVRAAFEVPAPGIAAPYLAANRIAGTGVIERVGPWE
jgi:parallel beta-helix repeat protein